MSPSAGSAQLVASGDVGFQSLQKPRHLKDTALVEGLNNTSPSNMNPPSNTAGYGLESAYIQQEQRLLPRITIKLPVAQINLHLLTGLKYVNCFLFSGVSLRLVLENTIQYTAHSLTDPVKVCGVLESIQPSLRFTRLCVRTMSIKKERHSIRGSE